MDSSSISAVFTGMVALIGALVAAFVVWNGRKINKALDVINGMSPGAQIDAATLARLRETPHDERTPTEQEHLDRAGPAEEPQGPSPTVAEKTEAIYRSVNGGPVDQPPLYAMVATLELKFDAHAAETSARLERLEGRVGVPPDDTSSPG